MRLPDHLFAGEAAQRYSPRRSIRRMRGGQLTEPLTPTRSLVICTNPRTGSWALCTALARTGRAGYPSEYFIPWDEADWSRLWNVHHMDGFLAAMLREGTSANRIFGIKVMWGHVPHLQSRLAGLARFHGLAPPDLFARLLPDPCYVWLSRRDTVRQAVSHARAMRSGVWAVGADEAPRPPTAATDEVDVDLVLQLQREIEEQERRWADFFAAGGVVPLRLWYEDLLEDFPGTVRQVLDWLGVAQANLPLPAPDVRRQADAVTERWVRVCRSIRVESGEE